MRTQNKPKYKHPSDEKTLICLLARSRDFFGKKPPHKTTTTLWWLKCRWINQVPLGSNSVICDQLVFSKKANQKGPVRTWHFNLPVSTLTLTQIQKHDVLNNHKFQSRYLQWITKRIGMLGISWSRLDAATSRWLHTHPNDGANTVQ